MTSGLQLLKSYLTESIAGIQTVPTLSNPIGASSRDDLSTLAARSVDFPPIAFKLHAGTAAPLSADPAILRAIPSVASPSFRAGVLI